jgi:hypothetical protein
VRLDPTNIRGNGRVTIDADEMPIGQDVTVSVAIARYGDPYGDDVIHVAVMRTAPGELVIGIVDVGAGDERKVIDIWPEYFDRWVAS